MSTVSVNPPMLFRALLGWLVVLTSCRHPAPLPPTDNFTAVGVVDVADFGARGDGVTLDTVAIQRAIDTCHLDGGGRVLLKSGVYLSGTLVLKSNVTLTIARGATLRGSPQLRDYTPILPSYRSYTDNYTDKSLIYAEGAEAVGLSGEGTIDGQGATFKGPYKVRPFTLRFVECTGVRVRDLTIRNSPMWVQHYLACTDVLLDGLTVTSRVNLNNDGIDIDSCRNVRIANCNVTSGDDALVLKSSSARPCSNVVITNCVLSSDCNALKMGTESSGGFQDITISNCVIHATRLAGLALEIVDGGLMDRVTVTNLTMTDVGTAIFVRLGDRGRPFAKDVQRPGVGGLRNVVISNVMATGIGPIGCAITGLPQAAVQNLTLDTLHLEFLGGGTSRDAARTVPELPSKYPEFSMFGTLPAYGFYVRHVTGLSCRHVRCEVLADEQRPGFVIESAEDVQLVDVDVYASSSAQASVWLRGVRGAYIHSCRPRHATAPFVRIDGADSRDVALQNNDFSQVAQPCILGPGVPDSVCTRAD